MGLVFELQHYAHCVAGAIDEECASMRPSFRLILSGWRRLRSFALVSFYRMVYPTLHVGRRVYLGRDVSISIWTGGSIRLGDYAYLESCSRLEARGTLSIGSHAYVGTGTVIVATEHVAVGRDALIAGYVAIRDQDHRTDDPTKPYRLQGMVTSPVVIGDNVWIGTQATVLRGVRIGDNSIIGANSVVSKSVAADRVAVGSPARVIKELPSRPRRDECGPAS